jgi:DsbE subfamily thiol:disulfide oxidoreductase
MKNKHYPAILALFASVTSFSAHAVNIGQPAPAFTLPSLQQNTPTALSQFVGKVVYLDFWASWCAPCRTSFPLLNKLHQKLQAQGFDVVAVNLDEDKAKAEQFLKDYPVTFNILSDPAGQWADTFGVESMPTSYIIDKKGVVQHVHHGFASDDIKELETKITQLLTQK